MKEIVFNPIGIVHSPHKVNTETPVQPVFCGEIEGTVEIQPEYADGLKSLDGFSHIFLFYEFDQSGKTELLVKPYLQDVEHGIFATRKPHRPNKLGMSLVELIRVDGCTLHVKGVDILDGTPLIDIKPYVTRFDVRENARSGWQDNVTDDDAAKRGLRSYKQD